jgi:hypothetical protein
MNARKLGLLLAILAVLGSIVFSGFVAVAVFASPAHIDAASTEVKSGGNKSPPSVGSRSIVVSAHKITATELQELETKVGVSVEGQDYNDIVAGHGTGLRAPTASEWQEISQTAQIADSATYPASPGAVDNSVLPWFPPIGNQGTEGSCVAWSVGYYVKTFQEAKEHGWDLSGAVWVAGSPGYPTASYQNRIMSPEFLYHLVNNGLDDGASFQDAINVACSVGVSSWMKMPYSQTDHSSWPSEQAWTEALWYRGNSSGYQVLSLGTAAEIQSLKNLLAAGTLVTIGVNANLYSALTNSDVWTLDNYAPAGASSINHANTVVGYDDSVNYTESGVVHQGAFKVANSWGRGGWEHVADGFYWISYEAMRQRVGATSNAMFYYDRINYQPELLASFRINHAVRGDCQITVGVGSTSSPTATRVFTQYIRGGSFPFPVNNIIVDLTDFKNQLTRLYNQTYFLKVRDLGSPLGTSTLGTITSFSIGDVNSPDAPRATVNNNYVYLTLTYSLMTAELSLAPTSGPAGTPITIGGVAFTPSRSVNISYLNPATSQWTSLVNNTATDAQGQFTVNLSAPDLLQSSPAGDNAEAFDPIVFRAADNANGLSCNASVPFNEWRRGLTMIGNVQAAGLYGNNTDLASKVTVVSNQTLTVGGKWFSPGNVTLLWDNATPLTTALANETGYFTTSFTVPVTTAGQHEIILRNGNVDFHVSVARLPITKDDYDGSWRNADFAVNLISDAGNSTTYYRINSGAVRNVAVDGQPVITMEGGSNMIEYWSVDQFGNEETPHKTVAQVKLDKTSPFGSLQIGFGANYTNSASTMLNLTAGDALSGVKQVRFSNDGVWDIETWETPSPSKNWTLTLGDGVKTVYYQIMDNAGLTASYSASITLDMTKPTVNAGQDQAITLGSPATFAASQCNDSSGISVSVWDFGDGTSANGTTASHTYVSSGTYAATLTVTDSAGNTAASSITVTVQAKLSSTVPEFSAFYLLPLMVGGMLVSVIVKRKKHAQKLIQRG